MLKLALQICDPVLHFDKLVIGFSKRLFQLSICMLKGKDIAGYIWPQIACIRFRHNQHLPIDFLLYIFDREVLNSFWF